jgi:hypothetical protein
MDFYTFLAQLPIDQRQPFAAACGTTFGRLRQIAYGNEPASPQLCVAIDRESGGAVSYLVINEKWLERNGDGDGRRRIPMDWEYLKSKLTRRS